MTVKECSEKMEQYFIDMDKEIHRAHDVAIEARKKGYDPDDNVEIPLAKDMAERIEGIISVVCPQIIGSGVKERIADLEHEYGPGDWRVAMKIAHEVAEQKYCKFNEKIEAMEIGVRCGLAYLTVGVVAAPLEGFLQIKLRNRKDNGKEYFDLFYGGPIRAAGGTAACVSVVVADYVRKKMGYAAFDPTELEVKRYVREV